MEFFVTGKIGERRSVTPEGFLVCHDVPLARTGEQLYRPGEVPATIKPRAGTDYIRVQREPDEVFRPETMASAEGKPITIDHPPGMEVTPYNYRQLDHGHIQNIRRGEGANADLMLGDLVIKSAEGIAYARPGTEISMGYDCGYEELGEEQDLPTGLARQYGIIFNHAAMLDAGRCGPRCAIGDHSECTGDSSMSKASTVIDRLRAAFTSKDQSTFDAALADMGAGGPERALTGDGASVPSVTINNHMPALTTDTSATVLDKALDGAPDWFKAYAKSNDAKLAALDAKIKDAKAKDDEEETEEEKKKRLERLEREREKNGDRGRTRDNDDDDDDDDKKKAKDEKILGEFQLEAPAGMTGDQVLKAVKANDSAFLEDSFTDTVSAAEILAPGISVPTFDAKSPPRKTFDAVCGLRRKALDFAMNETAGDAIVQAVTGGRGIDTKTADCATVRTVFLSAVAMRKQANNEQGARRTQNDSTTGRPAPIRTIADLNKFNAQFRAGGKKTA